MRQPGLKTMSQVAATSTARITAIFVEARQRMSSGIVTNR
jgi:hypothetical protein